MSTRCCSGVRGAVAHACSGLLVLCLVLLLPSFATPDVSLTRGHAASASDTAAALRGPTRIPDAPVVARPAPTRRLRSTDRPLESYRVMRPAHLAHVVTPLTPAVRLTIEDRTP